MKVATFLDLSQNELRNTILQNLASAPSSPKKGQIYFNSGANVGYSYNGTSWRPLDPAALTDGTIQNSALATNPLARGNHTGTQAAATISDLASTVQAYRVSVFAAPNADVPWGGQKITTLADPVSAQDAATKNYVDTQLQSAVAGIDSKQSVRAVATSNVSLSGLQTVDGVSLVAGDRVLLTGQSTQTQNGVYQVASGGWSRAVDADQTGEITPGAFWFIEEGTLYGKTQWRCNNTGVITLGSTNIQIVQFGAASLYSAGNGLQLTGSAFSVKLQSSSGLVVDGTGLAVDSTVLPKKFASTITGNGSSTSFTVTHNLNTQDAQVALYDSSNNQVLADIQMNTVNTAVIGLLPAPGSGVTFRVVVIG